MMIFLPLTSFWTRQKFELKKKTKDFVETWPKSPKIYPHENLHPLGNTSKAGGESGTCF